MCSLMLDSQTACLPEAYKGNFYEAPCRSYRSADLSLRSMSKSGKVYSSKGKYDGSRFEALELGVSTPHFDDSGW